jgi:hypothetical protein
MSDNFIERESTYLAYLMDTGRDQEAADRLRSESMVMDRASFFSLVTQTRQKDQRGVGADLNIHQSFGPGYFENDLISVDKTVLQGDSKTPVLYQQPISQYQLSAVEQWMYKPYLK